MIIATPCTRTAWKYDWILHHKKKILFYSIGYQCTEFSFN